jgi:hypothetical protein
MGDTSASRPILATALLAAAVTLAAVVPLLVVSMSENRAPSAGLVVQLGNETKELHGMVLDRGAFSALMVTDEGFVALTWALYDANDDQLIASGETATGPPFSIDATLVRDLGASRYELLVTGTESDGDEVRRAARFEIT